MPKNRRRADPDEEYDVSEEFASYDLSKSKYTVDIRNDVVQHMTRFFQGKKHWAGGPISKSKLFKEEHIKAVMEMNLMDSFAVAYYCLAKNPPDTVDTSVKQWDIELCFESLKHCYAKDVPQCHAGGMVLVYLSMCHGVDFVPTLKKLNTIRAMVLQREKEMDIKILQEEQEEDLEDDIS